MADFNQPEYYVRREQQERALAAGAISPAIGAIHLELAERYAALAGTAEPAPRRARLSLAFA